MEGEGSMKKLQVRGILLLAFALFFIQLYGQSTNGSIGGTIEDVTQALLPSVMVTATNVDTGVASTSLTNETGAYSFPNLAPGQYKVTAELPSRLKRKSMLRSVTANSFD